MGVNNEAANDQAERQTATEETTRERLRLISEVAGNLIGWLCFVQFHCTDARAKQEEMEIQLEQEIERNGSLNKNVGSLGKGLVC